MKTYSRFAFLSVSLLILLLTFPLRSFADATVVSLAGAGPLGWDNGLWSGDGGPALNAAFNGPTGITRAADGSVVIADYWSDRIRAIDSTGIIRTIAGDGWPGIYTNGQALGSSAFGPWGVAALGNAIVYTDTFNSSVRSINPDGTLTQVAGVWGGVTGRSYSSGWSGFDGDNGPATSAHLNWPLGITTDTAGNVYIADSFNQRIRKIDASGTITTVAGNGWTDSWGHGRYAGDGGLATNASLNWPTAVAVDKSGNLYIADAFNQRIRKVNASTKIITTVAGTGKAGDSGDEGFATQAEIDNPAGMAFAPDGTLYFADSMNHRIRSITTDGKIHAVAGSGVRGHSGDFGPALQATFDEPRSVVLTSSGDLIVADTGNNAIRLVLFGTTGSVQGTVRDANTNTPLPGATVTWNSITTVSDANGNYSTVAYPGAQPITAHLASYGTVTDTVSVVGGSTVAHDFLLPSGNIQGVVVDDLDQPVAGATVKGADNSATTNTDGTFTLRLAPGSQTIIGSMDGYATASAPVNITAGQSTSVKLVLYRLTTIPVNLVYTNDWISSHENPGDFDSSLGFAYPAEQLPPSNSTFSIPRGQGSVDFVFPDKSDGAHNVMQVSGQTLNVPAARYSTVHMLEASMNGAFQGAVTMNYQDGTSDTVMLTWSDWAWNAIGAQLGANETPAITCDHRHSATSATNSLMIDILHMQVPVDASKLLVSITLPTRTTGSGGQPYIFAMSLDVLQSALGTVKGHVLDANTQAAVPGAVVSGGGLMATADSSGAFSMAVLPGTQTYTASANTYGNDTASLTAVAGQTTQHDFMLPSGTIAGLVVDDAGHVLGGATVSTASFTVTSLANGTFSVRQAPGSQTVNATKSGYVPAIPQTVTVQAGKATPVRLMLSRPNSNWLPLTLAYTADWISWDSNPGDYTTPADDYAFTADQLPASNAMVTVSATSVPFLFPDKTDGALNALFVNGQTVSVPPGRYSSLHFLEASQFGAVTAPVTLNYSDGSHDTATLVFSDWAWQAINKTLGANETVAFHETHRNKGGNNNAAPPVDMLDSQMPVDASKTLVSFTLPPDGSGIHTEDAYIIAASLNSVGGPLQYGDVDGNGSITAADAALALRCAAGLSTLDNYQMGRADVCPNMPDGSFGDGVVGLDDAVGILRLVTH